MSTRFSSPGTDSQVLTSHRDARGPDHISCTAPSTEGTRTWRIADTRDAGDGAGDLTTDLAASLYLSLFLTPVGSARATVTLTDLAGAVRGTGPRGVRAAGHGGEALLRRWERAGLVGPVLEDDPCVTLLPRGAALLNGPFRWDRLTRALRRHS